MINQKSVGLLVSILFCVPMVLSAASTEKIRNEKVVVVEQALQPGEIMTLSPEHPSVVVYLDNGAIAKSGPIGKPQTTTVKRGETDFEVQGAAIKNTGAASLRIVRTEVLSNGSAVKWGREGLAPDYDLLFENQYARAYNIKVTAGKTEPLHSHKDRVVICLSGAELQHEMADGRREVATLKTGEIVWRKGVTHIGHNLGKTDLWAIAIEPK